MTDTTPIRIPKLSMAVEEADLVEWLVPDGARVEAGQAIFSIATDKVETEIEAAASGVVRQREAAGRTYQVGTAIGEIERDGTS